MKKLCVLLSVFFIAGFSGVFAQADMQENVAMIKKNLTESKAKMKMFEWIETTTIFLKGEQKKVIQKHCYYSLDGQLTKVETGGTSDSKKPGGIRGKIADNKKEDLSDYMKKAIEKIQTYMPPDPEKIQAVYGAGMVSIQILEPNKKIKLSFPDYNEKGDLVTVSIDKVALKIMALSVSTTVDDPKQLAVFNVTYKDLPDGTQYPAITILDAKEKDLKIVIENSGFKNAAK
jgi:hypothetical protein